MAEPGGTNAVLEPSPAPAPNRPRFGQRSFGLLAHAFTYAGYGGGLRAGLPWVGVLASVGWQPLLFYVERHFEYFNSTLVNGELYVTFAGAQDRFAPGFCAGYKYNSVLKSGATAAFYAFVNLTEKLALQGQIGLAVFPEGERQVRRRLENCDGGQAGDCSVDFRFSPAVHFGATVGILFFP